MPEHLSRERIAALLDGPEVAGADREHLERCETCTHEYEQMARLRMALSGLSDLEPPSGEWERIRAGLEDAAIPIESRYRGTGRGLARPLWAAAVIALFAAGLGIGQRLGPAEGTSIDETAPDPATAAYLRTVAEMERLRLEGASDDAIWSDPSAAAERLMRLDALIEASREALREAPTDPALNDFLFDVVDERESLAGRLDRSLRYASREY